MKTTTADALIAHLKTCQRCRRMPGTTRRLCATAKKLVQLTTKERHG